MFFTSLLVATAALGFQGGATPAATPDIYPAPERASKDIADALMKAQVMCRPISIILDFGGNWCGDCRALDKYFHQEPNKGLLTNFILVHVNIGKFDKNLDIAKKYGVPLDKGVPALAVLDAAGRVRFSQKKGEFESMRTMSPNAVTEFLKHWQS